MERKKGHQREPSYAERLKSADALGMKNYILEAFDSRITTDKTTRDNMRLALSAHLVNPWRTGEKDPVLLAQEVVTAYTPFSHALVSIVEDALNGDTIHKELANQIASWHVRSVDILANAQPAKKSDKEQARWKAHPLGAVDALVEELPVQDMSRLNLVSILRVSDQSYQAVDALFGLNAENEGSLMRAYTEPLLFGKKVRQLTKSASHTLSSPDAHTQEAAPTEYLMKQIATIELDRIRMGVDVEGFPAPRTHWYIPNPSDNVLENLAVRASMLHAVAFIRAARPGAHCALYPMPGGKTMIAAYRHPKHRKVLYEQVRRELAKEGTPLQPQEMATYLRFLFEPLEPEAQHVRLTALTDAFTSSTQRVYSGGYRVEFGRSKDPRMAQMGFSHVQYIPDGGDVRAEVGFRGSHVECVVHRDGRCSFLTPISDPEARMNVELIIKAHLVEAMREDAPLASIQDKGTGQPEFIEIGKVAIDDANGADAPTGQPVRQVAYLKGHPYGALGRQREDKKINHEVGAWTGGISFADMADAFLAAQLAPGFVPTKPETYRYVKEFKALPPEVQRKLEAVFARFPHKKSAPTVSGVVPTPVGYSVAIWPPREVERRLLCELAYIPEVCANLSDGPIQVSAARALEHYHDVLPALKPSTVKGTVYQG